jgi:alkaline phosphatase D
MVSGGLVKKLLFLLLSVLLTSSFALAFSAGEEDVFMANGVKVGEVTSTSAIVWTRLTRDAERNTMGEPFAVEAASLPREMTLGNMAGSVTGSAGEVRLTWWAKDSGGSRRTTPWSGVDESADFTRQFRLGDLRPGTEYLFVAQGRGTEAMAPSVSLEGRFRTAPDAKRPAPVSFVAVGCQDYQNRDDRDNGHRIYREMLKLDPDFFVHTGDIVYYDRGDPYAKSVELARYKWNTTYAFSFQREFHRGVSSYFMKDDHDTLRNDAWPGQSYGGLTWEQGLALFREQVPMGDKTYRSVRWGKDLQVWMLEGRDFRSPGTMPDGPEKTILGREQKRWFLESVEKSDALFRIVFSPTPIVGPDRKGKSDNHSNRGFDHEGDELRAFIGRQKNMYVVAGDRHWQYVSVHPGTGVREYGVGPTSDAHVGGKRSVAESPLFEYTAFRGGFLGVRVERDSIGPRIVFRHYGVDGTVYNEDRFRPE